MKLYLGTDSHNGWQYLLTSWPDGTFELATRPDPAATWSPPVALTPEPTEAGS